MLNSLTYLNHPVYLRYYGPQKYEVTNQSMKWAEEGRD